jgi:5-methylcytosine-specific restriction endonuclease McrA
MQRVMMSQNASVIAQVCAGLKSGLDHEAAELLGNRYPFVASKRAKRSYGELDATRVFIRDGFVDRYSGERVVFPAVLRVLSIRFPDQFPLHPNWKTEVTHPAYWQMSATIDHLVPLARDGRDDASNWVTTSMLKNSAKSNWTVEELGWKVRDPGSFEEWDGMIQWFVEYTAAYPETYSNPSVKRWRKAAVTALADTETQYRITRPGSTDAI